MGIVFGLGALVAAVAWIGWIALTVMTITEPDAGRALFWAVFTPVMAGIAVVALRILDRAAPE